MDGAIYGDWQSLAAPAPIPELTLRAKVAPRVRGKAPRVRITCSNECDVGLEGPGTFGVRTHLYVRVTTDVPAFGRRALRPVVGEVTTTKHRTRPIKLHAGATDDFGQRAQAFVKLRPGR